MKRHDFALLAATGILVLAAPAPATAASVVELGYPLADVWTTAVRLLRVDNGFEITDKDADSGYILFIYPGEGRHKKCPASLEMVPVETDRGSAVRVQLSIQHQPSYVEVRLLERLENKLRDERGPPRDPTEHKPDSPPKKPDPDSPASP